MVKISHRKINSHKFFARIKSGPVILLGLFLLLFQACSTGGDNPPLTFVPQEAAKAGYLAPNFSLTKLDGGQIKLEELKGKPVLLNFWATWCVPCRTEMPEIEAALRSHRQENLVVLGINAQEAPQAIQKFLDEGSYHWPMLLDPEGSVKTLFKVNSFPTSIFIDRQGYIRSLRVGVLDKAFLLSLIHI